MGQPLRLYIPGYWYHVYIRGQRGQPLFFSPSDRIYYLELLDEELLRQGGSIGSFCLMTNHTHLLLRQGEIPLNHVYHAVHTKFAKSFNRKRKTRGHVLQGRPGSKIVLDHKYLSTLIGYIHQNPVKARMVKECTRYKWSSWYWFDKGKCDWLRLKSWQYPPGFESKSRRRLFYELINGECRNSEEGQSYIGVKEEWEALQRRQSGRTGRKYKERRGLKDKNEIAAAVIKGIRISLKDLQSQSRNRIICSKRHEAMALMYEEGYGPTDIGKFFNRSPMIVIRKHAEWKETNEHK